MFATDRVSICCDYASRLNKKTTTANITTIHFLQPDLKNKNTDLVKLILFKSALKIP